MAGIDLHTHSTASDGTDSPAELVGKAAQLQLGTLALTDHDTLDGLDEAEEAATTHGIRFIRGCELAVAYGGDELHLLAYWVPRASSALDAFIAGQHQRRRQRNQDMVARLVELGLDICMEDVVAVAGQGTVGRPHIAVVLKEKGYVATTTEAFERYIGRRGCAFVPRDLCSPQEGLSLMAGEGATMVLAHPCLSLDAPRSGWDALLRDLCRWGLSGIEAYHSAHSHTSVRLCVELAARHNLVLTGGSDYHGAAKPGVRLGVGSVNMRLHNLLLEKLQARRLSDGLPL